MLKIGLTGGLGTGKSTVAGMFAEAGFKIIDADAITRSLLTTDKKTIKKVAKAFPGVILKSGEVSRTELSNIVFKNPRELNKLTKILYPEAIKEVKRRISRYKKNNIILDVPLLFEAKWDKLSDTTIVVCARRAQQIQRIQKRMAIGKRQILDRLRNQMPLKDKCRLADIIIDNSGTLQETRTQVRAIIDRLKQRK